MAMGGISGGIGGGLQLPLELLKSAQTAKPAGTEGAEGVGGTANFASVLKGKLNELNTQQVGASKATEDVATGRVDDIAQTMMRIEQANVSLQMTTQMRNKVIESYQEIMRMQM